MVFLVKMVYNKNKLEISNVNKMRWLYMKRKIIMVVFALVMVVFIVLAVFFLNKKEDHQEISRKFYQQAFSEFFVSKQEEIIVTKESFVDLETHELLPQEIMDQMLVFFDNTLLSPAQGIEMIEEENIPLEEWYYIVSLKSQNDNHITFAITRCRVGREDEEHWYEASYIDGKWEIESLAIVFN